MKPTLAAFLFLLLGGCSLHVTHNDGSETFIGMMWLRQYPGQEVILTHTKRVGMALDVGSKGNGILLGYENLLRVTPPDDRIFKLDYSLEQSLSASAQAPLSSPSSSLHPETHNPEGLRGKRAE